MLEEVKKKKKKKLTGSHMVYIVAVSVRRMNVLRVSLLNIGL